MLNGKTGTIKKFDGDKGRYQVDLGTASLHSLKPENLRHVIPSSTTFVESGYSGSTAGYTLL